MPIKCSALISCRCAELEEAKLTRVGGMRIQA